MPAGLVDGGESSIDGARREVEEEIGATVLNIEKITNVGFTSVGLTDETMETYFAEVVLDKSQNLDEDEIIDIVRVNVDDIDEFLNTHLVNWNFFVFLILIIICNCQLLLRSSFLDVHILGRFQEL